MICLISTCYLQQLPGLVAFIYTMHMVKYFYGHPRAEHCHSILSPGLFDNYVENGRLKNSTTLGSFTQSSEPMRHRDPGLIQSHSSNCILCPTCYEEEFHLIQWRFLFAYASISGSVCVCECACACVRLHIYRQRKIEKERNGDAERMSVPKDTEDVTLW